MTEARKNFRKSMGLAPSQRSSRYDRDGSTDEHVIESRADSLAVKARLLERLLDSIGSRDLSRLDESDIAAEAATFVGRVLAEESIPLNREERERLAKDLAEEAIGLGPLAPLVADPAVTDILVNGPAQVFVERYGILERTRVRFRDDDHVTRVIERLAARVGRRIDAGAPMVDLRLPDGSRVNATIPPVSIDGPTISIRRFGRRRLRRADLLRLSMLSPDMDRFLEAAVRARENILISGGTGAGKSTLLGALAEAIPESERVVTIEDTAELVLDQAHVVRLETRAPNIEGRGVITARDLVVNSLRMRPDRIILGEVRGGEALDMLQAMNTGHEGSLCTIHANAPRDALSRLETMVLMSGLDLPSRAIREQITSAIRLIVHVRRHEDGVRRIDEISEITGQESETPLLQTVFSFRRLGRRGRRIEGEFSPSGIVPRCLERWREAQIKFPTEVFREGGPRG